MYLIYFFPFFGNLLVFKKIIFLYGFLQNSVITDY